MEKDRELKKVRGGRKERKIFEHPLVPERPPPLREKENISLKRYKGQGPAKAGWAILERAAYVSGEKADLSGRGIFNLWSLENHMPPGEWELELGSRGGETYMPSQRKKPIFS